YTYDGEEKRPEVTVKNAQGTVLTENKSYTVTYTDNVNAGTASVTVTGMGNYTGSKTVTFKIRPAQ
ncbi:MAG: hypothetical protein IKN57_12755, partial [Parasporobacterium sp.]|nr:hypothetical protein [Parasporobacterium sp.]